MSAKRGRVYFRLAAVSEAERALLIKALEAYQTNATTMKADTLSLLQNGERVVVN